MVTTVAIFVGLFALLGVALTILTLPGIWLAIIAAALAQWWHMSRYDGALMFDWWTLGICVGLGLIAEVIELLASAAGAAKAGGTRRGAIGSVVGGFIGAIGGTFVLPVPVLGTIVGAAAGAGAGAVLGERTGARTWKESGKVGVGAAAGRFVATIVKGGFAMVIAAILTVTAFV